MAESPSFNFIELGYDYVDLDLGGGLDVDGDSYALGGSFEIGYVGFGSDAGGTAVGAGAYFHLSDNFALGLGVSFEDDVTAYGASARFYFDK